MMFNVNFINLLAYIGNGANVPRCLNCNHVLGSDGDGLVYCAYCLECDSK